MPQSRRDQTNQSVFFSIINYDKYLQGLLLKLNFVFFNKNYTRYMVVRATGKFVRSKVFTFFSNFVFKEIISKML